MSKKQKAMKSLRSIAYTYIDRLDLQTEIIDQINKQIDSESRDKCHSFPVPPKRDFCKFDLVLNGYNYRGVKVSKHFKKTFKDSAKFWGNNDCASKKNLLCHLPIEPEIDNARHQLVVGLDKSGASHDVIARFCASQLVGSVVTNWNSFMNFDSIKNNLNLTEVPKDENNVDVAQYIT